MAGCTYAKRIALVGSFLLMAGVTVWAVGEGPTSSSTDQEIAAAAPLGTAFTYQGQLQKNGAPVTDTCDMKFAVYDSAAGSTLVGPWLYFDGSGANPPVEVNDGLFLVKLDFGPGVFTGEARWLRTLMRCPAGTGDYTDLDPLQELTPTPYAVHAASGAGGGYWSANGDHIYSNNAGNVGIGVTLPALAKLRVEAYAADGAEFAVWGRALSLSGVTYGVCGDTQSTTDDAAGVYGTAPKFTGRIYGVRGRTQSATTQAAGVYGKHDSNTGAGYGVHGKTLSSTAGAAGVCGEATGADGVGVYATSATGKAVDALTTSSSTNPWTPAIYGRNEGAGDGVYGWSQNRHGTVGVSYSPTNAGVYGVNNGGGYAAFFDGTTKTGVLEITGGADLSERFDITTSESQVEPGMVVCIDSMNPGKLVVCSRAYDRRVAGIVSGAGGVRAGMLMSQDGTPATGAHPVALTGRVWTWCDASSTPIRPGDLLTTSNEEGRAMAVSDDARAHGAIIGKAMTALAEGHGLVLVLVALQ